MDIEAAMQDAFTKAYRGLASQDWQESTNHYGLCRYRGPNGLRCAVGWLIPDTMYRESLENQPIPLYMVSALYPTLRGDDLTRMGRFLKDLQYAHDYAEESGSEMKARIEEVAADYGLIIPEPQSEKSLGR